MQIEVNGTIKNVPSDISEISLGIYIDWQNQYGKELNDALNEIISKEYDDDVLKEIFIDEHLDKEALQWFTFHTGHDFEALADSTMIIPLLQQYKSIRFMLKLSEADSYELPTVIDWNDEQWQIQDWRVDPKSAMSFNEIVTSKEVMRQIQKVGLGRWDAMPYLCAMFLRKTDEPFSDSLIQEESDRMELMKSLPLNHAFQVAFFLTSCVYSLKNTSAFSNQAVEETASQN